MELLEKLFSSWYKKELDTIYANWEKSKTDKNTRLKKAFEQKYAFLKQAKPSKRAYPSIDQVLKWESTRKAFPYDTKIEPLLRIWIAKITGLYKHGQTEKTGLCNLRIKSNVKCGRLTIALSKNTLSAKEQWEARLIKELKELLPGIALKDVILIISSKLNTLGGNATHCKNINEAIAHYTRGNFKIIFVCSNNARIHDILTFLDSYSGLSVEKQLPIEVQQDEAHNPTDGIPSKRYLIEQIIMNPYVSTYMPVSASNNTIFDETSTLWKKANLESNAIDYTQHSKTISTSDNYSSIADANKISFERYIKHPEYTEYNVEEFDEETFDEADAPGYYASYTDPEEIKADKKRRRQLEFCQFMQLEKLACTLGMNFLDNYMIDTYFEGDMSIETHIILSGIRNFHILTTPCRVALTIYLMKYALTKSYNPICIGLYRSEIHLRYKNKFDQIVNKPFGQLDERCIDQQVNEKIHVILQHIKNQGDSIERPVIIVGNYKPTGESITFVNYKYGTIRSGILLPGAALTREASYQGFLRGCYMDTKFRENAPNGIFEHPPKWIIGSQQSIDDALAYEKENDERIARLSEGTSAKLTAPIVAKSYAEDDNSNISVPVKIMILDCEDENFAQLRNILAKQKRSEDDKKLVLKLLKQMINDGAAECIDPTNKFSFEHFTLKDIRCYKRTDGESEESWRFRHYDSSHRTKQPYINNKTKMQAYNCELLAALDTYTFEGFTHRKTVMYLSYRYE